MLDFPDHKKIILFDGICNLCNYSVLKVIKNDSKNIFVFCALQSKMGQKILQQLKIDIQKIDSVILYEPGSAYYIKSEAALKIMSEFGGFWKISQILHVFPSQFLDFFYNIIAANRYKWFGKKQSCMIPTPELKAKFLA